MRVFFKNIPNTITLKDEKYYQTIIFCILTLLGLKIDVEVNSNLGRLDAVVETDDHIHIMEFKVNGSSSNAIAQIYKNDYPGKYALKNKDIILYGVSFSQEHRNIGDVCVETV